MQGDLPPTGDPAKVASILTKDGYTKVGGKWTKNGQQITFSITDPIAYSDYYTDDQLIASQLNKLGFNVKVDGNGSPRPGRPTSTTAPSTPRSTGATRARTRSTTTRTGSTARSPRRSASRPPATTAASRTRPAQAALAQFAGTNDPATQKAAITSLQQIMSAQVPMTPLLYGARLERDLDAQLHGWPTNGNAYMTPIPNSPYLETVVLHLKPAS